MDVSAEDALTERLLKLRVQLASEGRMGATSELRARIDLLEFQMERDRRNPPTKPHPDWQTDVPDE